MESIRYRTIELKNARVEIGWWQRPGIGLDFEYDVEGPDSSVERNFTARFPLRAFTVHWIRWRARPPAEERHFPAPPDDPERAAKIARLNAEAEANWNDPEWRSDMARQLFDAVIPVDPESIFPSNKRL